MKNKTKIRCTASQSQRRQRCGCRSNMAQTALDASLCVYVWVSLAMYAHDRTWIVQMSQAIAISTQTPVGHLIVNWVMAQQIDNELHFTLSHTHTHECVYKCVTVLGLSCNWQAAARATCMQASSSSKQVCCLSLLLPVAWQNYLLVKNTNDNLFEWNKCKIFDAVTHFVWTNDYRLLICIYIYYLFILLLLCYAPWRHTKK